MIEIKVKIDEIDYQGIAELAMPVVKEKISEREIFLGGLVGKHILEPALNGALNGFLKFLTPEQKDEVALSLIHKYQDKIIEVLQNTALDKGVDLTVKDLSVAKVDVDD